MLAMVLTHNSPDSLARTVRAIAAQTSRPESLLVVDNASDPPARQVIDQWTEPFNMKVTVVSEAENSGPGGGWARAMQLFLASGDGLAWLLDDDIVPPPDCLAILLEEAGDWNRAYVLPSVRQPSGITTTYPAWHGVLLARAIVETVGVPRADFFWWAEDTEYLMWRIPRAGYPMRHSGRVVVEHHKARGELGSPPWKYYYETRNSIYYHLHLRRGRGRWPRKLVMLMVRALLREKDRRIVRVRMILRGVVDGVCGRLGRRVEPAPSEASLSIKR